MTILDEIRAHKEVEVAARKAQRSMAALIEDCTCAAAVRSLKMALKHATRATPLIAEVKRRSPARGDLRPGADAPTLAESYARAGAASVSVLTDERFFAGSDADLVAAHDRIAAPVLRKDFIIDAYQIYEARTLGADAVLLIVSLLTDAQLREFLETAKSLGMYALVEAHTADEVRRACDVGAEIVGINNRDLGTFTVDLGTTDRLRPLVRSDALVVSESGIQTRADVERVRSAGADAVLVGEALVTAKDPAAKVRELVGSR